MAHKTLLVLAAGIGSRFGGAKQMAGVGPAGEFIIDYSIFDAVRAGFDRVAFIIRKDIEADFRATIGERVEKRIDTVYIFQERDALPPGFRAPADRVKPWGTGHALLCAAPVIREPFGVINADDFYGAESYTILARFLDSPTLTPRTYALIGFRLARTLSALGGVSRGVCRLTDNGDLAGIEEVTGIARSGPGITAGGRTLPEDTIVSMNLLGFQPDVFEPLRIGFEDFLKASRDKPGAEFYIPSVLDTMIRAGAVRVRVLTTPEHWVGITYREELEAVRTAIQTQVADGRYPAPLWVSPQP